MKKMIFCSHQTTVQGEIGTIQAIAIILAQGIVRLLRRQKALDTYTEQSVHDHISATKGTTE